MDTLDLKKMSDEQLAELLQCGEECAMRELYTRYYPLVFNKCLSFSKSKYNASDLVQDVMLRVMENIHLFKGNSKFSTWLYAITTNYCIDQIRKTHTISTSEIDPKTPLIDHSEEEIHEAIELDTKENLALQAIARISKEDQQLLILKYRENKTNQDLQRLYHLSGSAIKMRLKRAKARASAIYSSCKTRLKRQYGGIDKKFDFSST